MIICLAVPAPLLSSPRACFSLLAPIGAAVDAAAVAATAAVTARLLLPLFALLLLPGCCPFCHCHSHCHCHCQAVAVAAAAAVASARLLLRT